MISDIHGCLTEFKRLLQQANYHFEQDQLILLGDYIDRGPNSFGVVEYVKMLVESQGVIALLGNHDKMFLDFLKDPVNNFQQYFRNGGLHTISSYINIDVSHAQYSVADYIKWANRIKENYPSHIALLSALPLYHIDDNHIFVHAGVNFKAKDLGLTDKKTVLWIREGFLDIPVPEHIEKTIVHGHTPTITFHNGDDTADILHYDGKIAIDGACTFGYQLNALEINEKNYHSYVVKNKNMNS